MFRALLICLAAVLWLFALWMGTHTSSDPAILGRYSSGYALFLTVLVLAALTMSLAALRPVFARVERAKLAIVVMLSSLTFSLLAAEAFVRLVDPIGIGYYEEAGRYHLEKVPDDQLVYKHRPFVDTQYQGVMVRTNSLGLRDRDLGDPKTEDLRIVALGDSVTFGWGVERDDLFTEQLEALTASRAGLRLNVINTGVGSYNTRQQRRFFELYHEKLAPDGVILIYVPNDVEIAEGPFDPQSEVSLSGKSPPEQLGLVLGRSWLYRMLIHGARYFRAPAAPSFRPALLAQNPGFTSSMDSLVALAGQCRELEIPLLVFFFRFERSLYTDELLEAIRARGVSSDFGRL